MKSLHTRHRPRTWADVIGQDATVSAFSRIIKRNESQAYILSGPSGTGKTTLARIAARELGCEPKDILEVNAAKFTGIDAMRAVEDTMQYKPFGASKVRAAIIDEVHALSRQAFQSLLKGIEEPPSHLTWFLCTTEIGKVPITVRTRCTPIILKLVSENDLRKILNRITKLETIKLDDNVQDLIVKEAYGSPRQLLVNLSLCRDVTDRKSAATILKTVLDSDAVRQLCQYVVNGGSWSKAMIIIEKLKEENPESCRIVVCNYVGAAIKNAKNDKEAIHFLRILEAFATPFNSSEGMAPLMLAIGRVLFGGE